MSKGPGKYDAACTAAREATQADAVVLIVFNGIDGSGFSVQSVGGLDRRLLATTLEVVATTLEVVATTIREGSDE